MGIARKIRDALIARFIRLLEILEDANQPTTTSTKVPMKRIGLFSRNSFNGLRDVLPYNAPHHRLTKRVAVWQSVCMRLLCVIFEYFPS